MFQRKTLFFALVVLMLACLAGWLVINKSSQPDQPAITFLPEVTGKPPLSLSSEDSGELWRKSTKSADGSYVAEEHVGYNDGRIAVFYFDAPGKLARLSMFATADEKTPMYEAFYDASNRIVRSRQFRADGTLEAETQRLPDGSEQRDEFAADGITSTRVVTTAPDGSQRSITAGVNGAAAVVTDVKADESVVEIGQQVAADGTTSPMLKATLKGVRLVSWEMFNAQAQLSHSGRFLADGQVEITVFNKNGRPVYRQIWKQIGEDWNRPFYRLTRIEAFQDYNGSLAASVDLYEDGATPREVTNYSYYGQKNSVDSFDRQGYLVRRQYYYGNDIPTTAQEFPAGQRQRMSLQQPILVPPALDGAPVYRMQGHPFGLTQPDGGYKLSPFFVLK